MELAIKIAFWSVPILTAVVLHELAHGYTAYRLGDPTAARLGRLSLNPLAHIDPLGTVLLPLLLIVTGSPFLFGYAKPVPVNFANLRNPRRDMVYVAAAGPAMNLFLAVISAFFLQHLQAGQLPTDLPLTQAATPSLVAAMLTASVFINVALAVFNLFPLPPLDGGRVAVGLLPRGLAFPLARLEPYGMFIIIGLLMTGVLGDIIRPVTIFLLNALL
jgi:Zn-dependent protease